MPPRGRRPHLLVALTSDLPSVQSPVFPAGALSIAELRREWPSALRRQRHLLSGSGVDELRDEADLYREAGAFENFGDVLVRSVKRGTGSALTLSAPFACVATLRGHMRSRRPRMRFADLRPVVLLAPVIRCEPTSSVTFFLYHDDTDAAALRALWWRETVNCLCVRCASPARSVRR